MTGAAPDDGFDEDRVGPDGCTMPASQHDAVLWISGSACDFVLDVARAHPLHPAGHGRQGGLRRADSHGSADARRPS